MDCFGDESAIQMISSDEEFMCPICDDILDMPWLHYSSGSEHEETRQISSFDLPLWTESGSDLQFDELLQDSDSSIESASETSFFESTPLENSDRTCQEFCDSATTLEPDPTPQNEGGNTLWYIDPNFSPVVSYKKLRMMKRITIEQAFVSYFAEKGQLYDVAPIIFDKNDADRVASEVLARRVKIGRAGRKLQNERPVRSRSPYMKLHGALMKAKWTRVIYKDTAVTQYFYFRL